MFIMAPTSLALQSGTLGTQALDANNDGAGAVYLASRTGTITKVGILYTAKTGTAPTYRVGIESATATRSPDGTYLGAAAGGYVDVTNPSTGFTWHTLGASVSVTAGTTKIAATIRYQSGTVNASNFATVAVYPNAIGGTMSPYALTLTGGSWSAASGFPCIAVQYDDGVVERFGLPISSATSLAWNSGSSPLFVGTKWTPTVGCTLVGAIVANRLPTNADQNLKLFTGSSSSPTATSVIDPDVTLSTSSNIGPGFVPIIPTALTAGTVYRIVLEPTTANDNTTFVYMTCPDLASLKAFWGELRGTTAATPGTWTDYDNGTDGYRAYPVIPVVTDFSASGGAGPLAGPGRLIRT